MATLVVVRDLAGEKMVVVINEEVIAPADGRRGLRDVGRWLFYGSDGNLSNEERTGSRGLPKSLHKMITVVLFDGRPSASRLLHVHILHHVTRDQRQKAAKQLALVAS